MDGDDAIKAFTRNARAKAPTASSQPSFPSSPEDQPEPSQKAFDNKVRPICLQIRCHGRGFSYAIPYSHLGAIIFNFRTGGQLSFTGCGLGVTVCGRNLGDVDLALRMHACALIEDNRPEPRDPHAAYIESIRVEVLSASPLAKPAKEREEM
jgi:hypothetical protein